jgi:hypothetical protein
VPVAAREVGQHAEQLVERGHAGDAHHLGTGDTTGSAAQQRRSSRMITTQNNMVQVKAAAQLTAASQLAARDSRIYLCMAPRFRLSERPSYL